MLMMMMVTEVAIIIKGTTILSELLSNLIELLCILLPYTLAILNQTPNIPCIPTFSFFSLHFAKLPSFLIQCLPIFVFITHYTKLSLFI